MENNQDFENTDSLKLKGDNYMLDKQYLKAVNNYTLAISKIEEENNDIEKKNNNIIK